MVYDTPHPIGAPFDKSTHPAVFQLELAKHVVLPHPSTFGEKDVAYVNPNDYFVTSGDAVAKAQQLEIDLWALAGCIRKASGKPKRSRYEQAVWKAAGQARSLVNKLKEARGEMCFLETEWRDRQLLIIPKNPRNRTK